jgi:hypothetical protein
VTDRPRRGESYVVNAILASAVLYWVLDLNSSGRTLIDWLIVSAVSLAVAWNVVQLSRRLHVLGGAAVWHVQRTVLFWIIGLLNTIFRAPEATANWKFVTGLILLGLAAIDTVLLWRKERRVLHQGTGLATE